MSTFWGKTPDMLCRARLRKAQVRSLFDTNFLGVVRVTDAVLPMKMREQRSGRILDRTLRKQFGIGCPTAAHIRSTQR